MSTIQAGNEHLIAFVLVDSLGAVVEGLGTGFTVQVSKNGGAFAAGTGDKAEVSNGWYSYELTSSETDTEGPLAVVVTGTGVVQENLLYQVAGSVPSVPAGSTILSAAEGAEVLRCESSDAELLALLPIIDKYIEDATGHDWASDATVHSTAKAAARMLLVMWHENPGMMANGQTALSFGLQSCLVQLEAIAQNFKEFSGGSGAGACDLSGARVGDTVTTLIGLIGVSGDQSASFETVITVDDQIQQVSTSDLSDNWYRVTLTPVSKL